GTADLEHGGVGRHGHRGLPDELGEGQLAVQGFGGRRCYQIGLGDLCLVVHVDDRTGGAASLELVRVGRVGRDVACGGGRVALRGRRGVGGGHERPEGGGEQHDPPPAAQYAQIVPQLKRAGIG